VDVLVTPLGRDGTRRLIGRPRAMVVVGGVPTQEPTLDAVLCRLYGFTAAEARLVLTLVESDGLAAAAGELGITLNTARTHLKRVFEKTGTRRQSDLIRRLLRGPLALR
jgi:DNA-binding CsgD family transcriptional regulator